MPQQTPSSITITVIIPAYNEELLIARCLESVALQDPSPDEILIVDNASTDHTAEIVTTFIQTHPKLNMKLIYETRRGCPAAREAGWRAASGSVIVHIDADEIMPVGWFRQVRDTLTRFPELGAFGGTVRFENAPPVIWAMQTIFNLVYPRIIKWTRGFPYLLGGMTVCKRELLEKMDGYSRRPDSQLEDFYLSEQAHRLGYKTRYFPSIYGIHSLRRYEQGGLAAFLKWGVAGLDATKYDLETQQHEHNGT
ncbi:MAG TPA: glycosyltransferase family 2 protein [Aggregatilineales bacterium]|nr:glycosyltransferase family 2 protein [Aggregatilineales bacterium]